MTTSDARAGLYSFCWIWPLPATFPLICETQNTLRKIKAGVLITLLFTFTTAVYAMLANVTVRTGHNTFGDISFSDRVGKLTVLLKEYGSDETTELLLDDNFHYFPSEEYEYRVNLWVQSLSDLADHATINWQPNTPDLTITADFVHFEHGTDRKSYYFDPLEKIFSSLGWQQD